MGDPIWVIVKARIIRLMDWWRSLIFDVPADPWLIPNIIVSIINEKQPVENLLWSTTKKRDLFWYNKINFWKHNIVDFLEENKCYKDVSYSLHMHIQKLTED